MVVSNLIGPLQPHVRSCKQDTPTKLEGPHEIHEIVPKPSYTGETSASRKSKKATTDFRGAQVGLVLKRARGMQCSPQKFF